MNAETAKVKAKLAALTSSFDDLESLLEPLFAQTLPETLVELEPLQQAKLQTVLPYVVYDLIFIYLKSRGIDPKTHPVIPELDRIREYFEKINNAENPPAKRTEIDKAAASRFIKHAITQAQWKKTPAEEAQDDPQPSTSATASAPNPAPSHIPVKVTQKMLARAAYEKEMKARDADAPDDEDDSLEVFNDEEDMSMDVDADADDDTGTSPTRFDKGKGKEVAPTTSNKNKRRRPAIDPFAGYGDDSAAANTPSTSAGFKRVKSSSHSPPPSEEPTSNAPPESTSPSQQPTPTPQSTNTEKSKSSSKKTKKKEKKTKKPTS